MAMFVAICSEKSVDKGFTYSRVAGCQYSYLPSIHIDQPKLGTSVWPSNFEYFAVPKSFQRSPEAFEFVSWYFLRRQRIPLHLVQKSVQSGAL